MKSQKVLLLLVLLSVGALSQTISTSGGVATMVADVSFNLPNNSIVGPNDSLVVRVNVTHGYSPKNVSVEVRPVIESNTTYYSFSGIVLEYNSSSGLYEGNITIDPYLPEGLLYIPSIIVIDPSGILYFNDGTHFVSPFVQVVGTTLDMTPPDLAGFWTSVPNNTVLGSDDNITFTVNVIDNESGLANVTLDIYYLVNNITYDWIDNLNFYPPSGETNFTGSQTLTVSSYMTPGVYTVALNLFDLAGNYRTFLPTDLNFTFVVNGTTPDVLPPVVNFVGFNTTEAVMGQFVEVLVDLSDDHSGVSEAWIEVFAVSSVTGNTTYVGSEYWYGNGGLAAVASLTVWIPFLPVEYDTLYIESVGTFDKAGNMGLYVNGIDFNSSIIPLLPGSLPPVEIDVWVDSPIHHSGDWVTFGMSIIDNSSMSLSFNDTGEAVATIVEDYGNGTVYSEDVYAVSNGTDLFYFDYWIINTAPNGTLIYIESISLYFNSLTTTFVDGVNMTSPVVTVVNAPSGGYIEVLIEPNYLSVEVNQTVNVNITVVSHFGHDMPNVQLIVEGEFNGASFLFYDSNFSLPAFSSISLSVALTFTDPGHYVLFATLYDDIGAPWGASIEADVVLPNTTTPTPTTSTNSTTPTNSTTSTNTIASPSLEVGGLTLPGFDLYLTAFAFASIGVIVRKKRKF